VAFYFCGAKPGASVRVAGDRSQSSPGRQQRWWEWNGSDIFRLNLGQPSSRAKRLLLRNRFLSPRGRPQQCGTAVTQAG
jgi:hypothetical protein